MAVGGGRPTGDEIAKGWWVEPTLFADVDNCMTIAQEEIFGPVLVAIPYGTEDEAIRIANDSKYGLSGGVFSGSVEHSSRWPRIRTGGLSINDAPLTARTCLSAGTSTAASAARTASPGSSSIWRSSRWRGPLHRQRGARVVVTSDPGICYDPYDFDIDADPYRCGSGCATRRRSTGTRSTSSSH